MGEQIKLTSEMNHPGQQIKNFECIPSTYSTYENEDYEDVPTIHCVYENKLGQPIAKDINSIKVYEGYSGCKVNDKNELECR
jgi:hypothetical protein